MKRQKVKIYERSGDKVKIYNGHMGTFVWESEEYYEDAKDLAKKDEKPSKCLDSK